MRFASGLLFLFAVSMFFNAIDGKWAFDRTMSDTKWVVLDVVIALVFLVVSFALWRVAMIRDAMAACEGQELDTAIATPDIAVKDPQDSDPWPDEDPALWDRTTRRACRQKHGQRPD